MKERLNDQLRVFQDIKTREFFSLFDFDNEI